MIGRTNIFEHRFDPAFLGNNEPEGYTKFVVAISDAVAIAGYTNEPETLGSIGVMLQSYAAYNDECFAMEEISKATYMLYANYIDNGIQIAKAKIEHIEYPTLDFEGDE